MSALVTLGILYAFQAHGADVPKPVIATTLLLIVPGFVATVAARPFEHEMAGRLLSGVRLLLLVSGSLGVAAAAALLGIKPNAWSVDDAWDWYTRGAAVIVGVLLISWVLSVRFVWRAIDRTWAWLEGRRAYSMVTAALALVVTVDLAVGALVSDYVRLHPLRYTAASLVIVVLALTLLGRREYVSIPPGPGLNPLALGGVVVVALGGAVLAWATSLDPGSIPDAAWAGAAGLGLAGGTAVAVAEARRTGEDGHAATS